MEFSVHTAVIGDRSNADRDHVAGVPPFRQVIGNLYVPLLSDDALAELEATGLIEPRDDPALYGWLPPAGKSAGS